MSPGSIKGSSLRDIPAAYRPTTMDIEEPGNQESYRSRKTIVAVICCLLVIGPFLLLIFGSVWMCGGNSFGGGPAEAKPSNKANSSCFTQSMNGSLVPSRDCPVDMVSAIGDINSKIRLLKESEKNGTESLEPDVPYKGPRP